MRNMNHITSQTLKKTIALLIATLTAASAPSYAIITVLSGGDAGEGYAPGQPTAYAYDVTGFNDATYTIQGVPFVNWALIDDGVTAPGNSSVTVFGAGQTTGGTPTTFGNSPSDIALSNVLSTAWFANGPLTLTLGGLSPTQQYQVDIFVETAGDSRQENFTFTGATVAADSFQTIDGRPWIVTESLFPNALGQIVVGLSGNYPFLNGFSVTQVPEPSTFALLAVGGLFLRRRFRSARVG